MSWPAPRAWNLSLLFWLMLTEGRAADLFGELVVGLVELLQFLIVNLWWRWS